MLVSEENIPGLIPQRFPVVMIAELLDCDEKYAVSRLTIREDNLFASANGFTAPGMMEAMAQTAAARTGYLLQIQQDGANKKPPVGVIGSIKNFRSYFEPPAGAVITTTIEIEYEVLQATVIKGRVETGGRLAAECEMQIFLTEEKAV